VVEQDPMVGMAAHPHRIRDLHFLALDSGESEQQGETMMWLIDKLLDWIESRYSLSEWSSADDEEEGGE
jgi:hypothetical protein